MSLTTYTTNWTELDLSAVQQLLSTAVSKLKPKAIQWNTAFVRTTVEPSQSAEVFSKVFDKVEFIRGFKLVSDTGDFGPSSNPCFAEVLQNGVVVFSSIPTKAATKNYTFAKEWEQQKGNEVKIIYHNTSDTPKTIIIELTYGEIGGE